MQLNELRTFLLEHGVSLEKWGTGTAKTLEHLLREIQQEEALLTPISGWIFRRVSVSAVSIFCHRDNRLLRLEEETQRFQDGRVRIRDLASSISEKIKLREIPEAAAHRAIVEELGIKETLQLEKRGIQKKGPTPSASYPSLFTLYTIHYFETFLPSHLYAPRYTERQDDKITIFVWKEFEG